MVPPLSPNEFAPKHARDPVRSEAALIETQAAGDAQALIDAEGMRIYGDSWKAIVHRAKELRTAAAHYAHEDLPDNQRMAAWLESHSSRKTTELVTQIEVRSDNDEGWSLVGTPTVRAYIEPDGAVRAVRYTEDTYDTLSSDDRYSLAKKFQETIQLIVTAANIEPTITELEPAIA